MSISTEARQIVAEAAAAAGSKVRSGETADPFAVDVSERLAVTDAFLVLTGANEPQVKAMVEAVEERLRPLGFKPTSREGTAESGWVLLDYLDAVVHVFLPQERDYYALERLWKDCPLVDVDGSSSQEGAASMDSSAREGGPASVAVSPPGSESGGVGA